MRLGLGGESTHLRWSKYGDEKQFNDKTFKTFFVRTFCFDLRKLACFTLTHVLLLRVMFGDGKSGATMSAFG